MPPACAGAPVALTVTVMTPALSRSPLARGWRDLVYLVSGMVLGLAWLIALAVLISVGIGTAVVIVGIPILALTMLLWRFGADTERERAALVLGAPITRPAPRAPRPSGWLRRLGGLVREGRTWRDLGYMLLLGPIGIVAGTIAVAAWAAVAAALATPAVAAAAPDGSLLGDLGGRALAGVALAAVPGAVLAYLFTRGLAVGCAAFARILLAGDDTAELSERIETLEASRSGAVESADAQLRRIERDLHDGAQHRLAYIAMELGRARGKLASDPAGADALLADAHDESKRAMRELRDLVRGIHPSVLSDRGLDAALSGLAERAAVPVAIDGNFEARLSPAVETAAYYVVAESLTNVGRHSGASEAKVTLRRDGGELVVEIVDDGHGGASRRPGSGLEGLAQRVEALDGTLAVDSPSGGPTTITARMPCAS
jgi:signal transduction histidine kinase